jgi:dimethylglycine catabolism B
MQKDGGKPNKNLVPAGLSYLTGNISTHHNIAGSSKHSRSEWAHGLQLPERNETVFFSGCGYQYFSRLEPVMSLLLKFDKSPVGTGLPLALAKLSKSMGIDLASVYSKLLPFSEKGDEEQPLRDAVKVLKNLHVDFGYLADEEPCCGGPLYFVGFEKQFKTQAQETYERLKSAGIRKIISMVPSCTYTLRTLYPQYIDSFDIEVIHFMEVVLDKIKPGMLRYPGHIKVVYHDPCQLARYLGIINEPREILKAIEGIELVEPERTSGNWATCCGGGGGFEVVFPDLSHILATNRVKELMQTEPDVIVTHCPGCIMQLKSGLQEINNKHTRVLDIAQILSKAMEG